MLFYGKKCIIIPKRNNAKGEFIFMNENFEREQNGILGVLLAVIAALSFVLGFVLGVCAAKKCCKKSKKFNADEYVRSLNLD